MVIISHNTSVFTTKGIVYPKNLQLNDNILTDKQDIVKIKKISIFNNDKEDIYKLCLNKLEHEIYLQKNNRILCIKNVYNHTPEVIYDFVKNYSLQNEYLYIDELSNNDYVGIPVENYTQNNFINEKWNFYKLYGLLLSNCVGINVHKILKNEELNMKISSNRIFKDCDTVIFFDIKYKEAIQFITDYTKTYIYFKNYIICPIKYLGIYKELFIKDGQKYFNHMFLYNNSYTRSRYLLEGFLAGTYEDHNSYYHFNSDYKDNIGTYNVSMKQTNILENFKYLLIKNGYITQYNNIFTNSIHKLEIPKYFDFYTLIGDDYFYYQDMLWIKIKYLNKCTTNVQFYDIELVEDKPIFCCNGLII